MIDGITVHMMVKNEGRWVWFALRSVIDYVHHVLVTDTGSIDSTVKCIEWFINHPEYGHKITFKAVGPITAQKIHQVRQEMVDKTETNWFMVVDGDEIWYEGQIKELLELTKNVNTTLIASRFVNAVGDVYHRQNNDRESYNICGEVGAITIRAYSKKIPGIHCSGIYGDEGYFDLTNKPVQERVDQIQKLSGNFLHVSYTARSSSIWGDALIPYRLKKIAAKYDYVVSKSPDNFPEVLFFDRPNFVHNPFSRSITFYLARASWRIIRKIRSLMKTVGI